MNNKIINYFEKQIEIYQKRIKDAEEELKVNLTKDLDGDNKENIESNIRLLCLATVQREFSVLMTHSNTLEAMRYLSGGYNLRKIEKEVREKFHVPDIIPIVFNE